MEGVRESSRARGMRDHEIWDVDPTLAGMVEETLSSYNAPRTHASYDSMTRQYVNFCAPRGVVPFPVDPVWLVAFMNWMIHFITVQSLKAYLSGIKASSLDAGHKWTLDGDYMVRRTLRSLKRKWGMAGKAMKVPLSLSTLRRMFAVLHGWPTPEDMCHNDRLFVAASLIGTIGFLRGGEFLMVAGKGARPLLKGAQVVIKLMGGAMAVVVSVVQPKARWWLRSVDVPCFVPESGGWMDPVFWLQSYRDLSTVRLAAHLPAFLMGSGQPLSRAWMVDRSVFLLRMANINVIDKTGKPVPVRASSWRAGGVASAKPAGISDALIMAMGRWSSNAWTSYSFSSLQDLQGAVGSMRRAAELVEPRRPVWVGKSDDFEILE